MRELNTGDEDVTTNPEPTDFLPVDLCSGRGRLIGGSQLGNFDGNRSGELVNGSFFFRSTRRHAAIATANSFSQCARSARGCTRSHSNASPLPGKGRRVRIVFARSQQLLPVFRIALPGEH
ncbi:hypothetical protein NDU88_003676 [Pleurodeles waltl]|uniref:Uncharacterized protein n=1 Tax=Pleurodeles waltl TaxID=8319 RepID=A0AAV7M7R6_PLEWA|nr:hypothetical protein NDU88_003676 [Pleurodeles waltl]